MRKSDFRMARGGHGRSPLRPSRAIGALLLALAVAACSDSSGPGDGGGDGPMSARIQGEAWSSDQLPTYNLATHILPGSYVLQGTRLRGLEGTTITFLLYNIRGPGSYALGMGPTTPGGTGQVVIGGAGWSTPLSGLAGTIEISTLTNDRIAGTFEFTAEAITGGATGTRQVTNGRFDLPVTRNGTVGPLPEHAGHRISATLGGAPWNASTVATSSILANAFVASTSNTEYGVNFSLSGFTGVGAYPLSWTAPGRIISVQRYAEHPSGAACCWGGTGSTGTVNITSANASRIVGTFSGTLTPQPGTAATGNIVISNGVLDVGRQ